MANFAFNLKGATPNKNNVLSNIFKPKVTLGKKTTTGTGLGAPLNVGSSVGSYLNKNSQGLTPVSVAPQSKAPVSQGTKPGLITQKPVQAPVQQPVQQVQSYSQPTQPAQQVQQNTKQTTYPTYTGLISEYANMARQGSEDVTKAREALQKFQQGMGEQYAGIENMGIPLEFVQGRQGALQRAAATTESSLQTGVQNALSAQQQQLGAFGSAAGLLAPIQAPYSNQILQFGDNGQLGGTTGGTGDINSSVQNAVQKLTSGQMTYDQAVSSLGGYGQAGVDLLQRSLPQGFNIAQSETLARQQGQVAPALQAANLSIDKLEEAMGKLSIPGQSSGFVPLNELTNWASKNLGWGKQQTSEVTGLVNEVRNALQNALSLTGTNPTEATAQSYNLLPDNPSLQNVLAAKEVLKSLGQIKQQVYGNPGLQGTNQGGAFAESWF